MSELEPEGAYGRGHAAGEIAARLAQHDKHFAAINGSIGDLKEEMHELVLAVQRLGDAMASDRATVITTAAALKEASARSWSPWTRLFAVLAAFAAAIAIATGLYALYALTKPR